MPFAIIVPHLPIDVTAESGSDIHLDSCCEAKGSWKPRLLLGLQVLRLAFQTGRV